MLMQKLSTVTPTSINDRRSGNVSCNQTYVLSESDVKMHFYLQYATTGDKQTAPNEKCSKASISAQPIHFKTALRSRFQNSSDSRVSTHTHPTPSLSFTFPCLHRVNVFWIRQTWGQDGKYVNLDHLRRKGKFSSFFIYMLDCRWCSVRFLVAQFHSMNHGVFSSMFLLSSQH